MAPAMPIGIFLPASPRIAWELINVPDVRPRGRCSQRRLSPIEDYVNEHYITNLVYKQQIQEYTGQIADLAQRKTTAWTNAMEHYEQYVQGEISKEEFRTVQDIANQAKESLIQATEDKAAYEKQYARFRELLSASSKDIPLSEILDCIDETVINGGMEIAIKWRI